MTREFDLSLYLVTDTSMAGRDRLPRLVREAVDAGVTLVQVRDRHVDDDEFARIARSVVESLAGTGVPVLLNDRVHLVQQVGADGAHIGQKDLHPEEARAALGPDAILGQSVGTPVELAAARDLRAGTLDYLGVGPVWPTATKPDHDAAIGLDGLQRMVAESPWPCVAIGGITQERLRPVADTGAAGVAVVSAICASPDAGAATGLLRNGWETAR